MAAPGNGNKSTSIDNIPSSTPVYAILHFDLDDDDGEGERRLHECLDAPKVLRAVGEYEQWLSAVIDQGHGLSPEYTRDKLFDCFAENCVKVPGWE